MQTPFIELPARLEGGGHLMCQFVIRSQPQIAGHIIPQSAEIVFADCWCTPNPHMVWAAHCTPDLYCLQASCGELFFMIPPLSIALGEEIKLTWFIYESFVIRMIEGHAGFFVRVKVLECDQEGTWSQWNFFRISKEDWGQITKGKTLVLQAQHFCLHLLKARQAQ